MAFRTALATLIRKHNQGLLSDGAFYHKVAELVEKTLIVHSV